MNATSWAFNCCIQDHSNNASCNLHCCKLTLASLILSKCWILMLLGMHKGFKFFQLSIELAIWFVFLCMWFGLLFVMLAICFTMFFALHPCNCNCCVHSITINWACGVISLLMSSFYGILFLNNCVSISYFHQTLVWTHPFLVDVKLCYILSIINYMCIHY
jgi:hypothetical protein